jgi:hypothetical protein
VRICAHTRSGTHLLAKLIWQNFETPHESYEYFDFSHSERDSVPYIHLHRPILDVMRSIWWNREHLGIASHVTFGDMLRTPWPEMPRSTYCHAIFNGERLNKVCAPKDFTTTLVQRWIDTVQYFHMGCAVAFSYATVCSRPLAVLAKLEGFMPYKRVQHFTDVREIVGWQPLNLEHPNITHECYRILEDAELCLRSRLSAMGRRF